MPIAQRRARSAQDGDLGGAVYSVGDVVTYSITVTNTGNQTLTGVTVSDPGVGAVLGTCTPAIRRRWRRAPRWSCAATHAVTQADLDAGTLHERGDGDSNQTPPNTDEETVPILQNPAMTVVKSVTSTGPYDSVGDVITYSITVTNTGNQTLTEVTVTDLGAVLGTCTPAIPATIAPGASVVCARATP